VAGPAVVVLWPGALRLGQGSSSAGARPFAFLGGAATSQLVSQTVLTGAPVLLALLGGSAAQVTALFAALALFRAPYMVALGAVPQLTVRVTRHSLAGEHDVLRRLTRDLLAAALVAALLAGLVGAWIGPDVLRLVFGTSVDVDANHAAVLAVGSTLAVANLVLMVTGLAQDRPGAVTRAWLLAPGGGAIGLAALPGRQPVDTTVGGFLVAEVAATVALAVVAVRSPTREA
jgi:O-antigen/teichoic acid export membrane protein